jgi:hypothetical protein
MNLFKQTKTAVALCAMLFASGQATAGAMAEAEISVTNLGLGFFEDGLGVNSLTPGVDFTLQNPNISFTGTSVNTDLNGNDEGAAFNGPVTDPLAPVNFDLDVSQSNATDLVASRSTLDGNIFTGTADGLTRAEVVVEGNSAGDAGSQIANSLDATFSFVTSADLFIGISFEWMIDIFASVFGVGGEANADWGLNVTLKEVGGGTGGFGGGNLIDFDLNEDELGGTSNTGTINTVGSNFDADASGTFVSDLVELSADTAYQLNIVQTANAAAVSVSGPASIGVFALALVGMSFAARRRMR